MRAYFRDEIEPLLDDPLIEFIGEIGDDDKSAFLGGAIALLFPIDWPEPFGLVMIEAMACGTPVIAWNCGSVPEIIDDGVTGRIVESLDEAVAAVARSRRLDRAAHPRDASSGASPRAAMALNYDGALPARCRPRCGASKRVRHGLTPWSNCSRRRPRHRSPPTS